jgi:hypothetical protein
VIEITLARSRLLRSPLFRLLLAIPAVERKEPLLLEWTGYQKLRHGELGSPDVGFWEIYYLWESESENVVPQCVHSCAGEILEPESESLPVSSADRKL